MAARDLAFSSVRVIWKRKEHLFGIVSILILLLVWYLLTDATHLLSPRRFAYLGSLAATFDKLLNEGYHRIPISVHFVASFQRALAGFALAVLAAIPVGLMLGMSRTLYLFIYPILSVIRPIPSIALIPLMILWFGIGETGKIVLIFYVSFLYITLNVIAGVSTVPEGAKRAAVNLGANRFQLLLWVILPAALPSIVTGLRVGLTLSWALVVAAELVAAQEGLGYMIMDASIFYRIPELFIGILMIGVIGFILEQFIEIFETRFVHWKGK